MPKPVRRIRQGKPRLRWKRVNVDAREIGETNWREGLGRINYDDNNQSYIISQVT